MEDHNDEKTNDYINPMSYVRDLVLYKINMISTFL